MDAVAATEVMVATVVTVEDMEAMAAMVVGMAEDMVVGLVAMMEVMVEAMAGEDMEVAMVAITEALVAMVAAMEVVTVVGSDTTVVVECTDKQTMNKKERGEREK